MGDWRQYVTLGPGADIIQQLKQQGIDPKIADLPADLKRKMETVLDELASTPEGMAVIRNAAARGPDGKVNIMYNKGGYTLALLPNDFVMGDQDIGAQYLGQDGKYHDLSLQRVVFHELQHHGLGHTRMNAKNESEAVHHTNQFMSKYYGEVPRSANTFATKITGGTPEWDMAVKKRAGVDGLVDPKQFANLDGTDVHQLAALNASPSHGGAKPDTPLART